MAEYTISELSALSGLPVRTIRYYLAKGLVPAAGREGPATRYPEATLARLRLIARLRDAHLPLAEVRRQLDALPDEAVSDLAAAPSETPPAESALDYVRSLLGQGTTTQPPAPEVRAWAEQTPAFRDLIASGPSTSSAPKPTFGERSQWERIVLTPDIELHVRRPLSRRDNRLVERLIAFARQLQGEDKR